MSPTDQQGSTLVETLVACTLSSLLLLTLMRYQIHLFHHRQYRYYQQLANQAQLSLAERLKSCGTRMDCQHLEIAQWQTKLLLLSPFFEFHCVETENSFINTIYWNSKKSKSTLHCYRDP